MEEVRATDELTSKAELNSLSDDKPVAERAETNPSTEMSDHNAEQPKNAEDKSLTQNGQANDTVPPFSESVDTRSAESSTSVASDEKAQPPTDSAGVSPLACLEEAEADEEENDQSGRVATLDQALSDSESATSSPQGDRDTGSAQKQAPSPKGESALSRRKPRVSHKSCKVYCHQCRQPVTASTKTEKCTKCGIKYCKPCLARRYGTSELSRSLGENGAASVNPDASKLANGHANWVCPKCLDICNCANCRRKKGLSPTGQVYRKVKKMGYASVHEYLKNDNDKTGNEDEAEAEETEGEDDEMSEKQVEKEKSPTKPKEKSREPKAAPVKEEKVEADPMDEQEEEEETDEANDLEEENDDDFVDNNPSDSENLEETTSTTTQTKAADKVAGTPTGKPIVSQGATILNLGTIVHNRPNFHSKRYLWPASFKSTRKIQSFKDSSRYVTYTSEIVDTGKLGPEFQVRAEDAPDVVFRLLLPLRFGRRFCKESRAHLRISL